MNKVKKVLLGSCMALALGTMGATSMAATAGEKVDDSMLTAKVKTALIESPATKARQINVDTSAGVVQLNGFVDSASEKMAAENAALNVAGVKRVDNNLQVRMGAERTAGNTMDDTAITAKVKTALIEDSRTKAYQVDVKTYKGVVSLGGFVGSATEKQAAEEVAQKVGGVIRVENGIKVGRSES